MKTITKLSDIISGTMSWGTWGIKATQTEMIALIECCIEHKITSFDHADIYGGYTTEAAFGAAFTASKIDRNAIQLITKCGIQTPSDNRKTVIKHYDYSKNYIKWSTEQSLKNLKTDCIDVLLLHRPSPLMQGDEIAEAVEQLKSEGKIIDFGLSNFSNSQTELIRQKTNVAFNQIQFATTHFDPMIDGSLDYMQLHQIQPLSWNPLGSVYKEPSEKTTRIKKALKNLENKYNLDGDLILLSWVMQHPAKVKPVIGTTNKHRIAQTKNTIQLDLEDWFLLWEASLGTKVP